MDENARNANNGGHFLRFLKPVKWFLKAPFNYWQ
jgi:hypothetical protein